jgi:hypothetical protein
MKDKVAPTIGTKILGTRFALVDMSSCNTDIERYQIRQANKTVLDRPTSKSLCYATVCLDAHVQMTCETRLGL